MVRGSRQEKVGEERQNKIRQQTLGAVERERERERERESNTFTNVEFVYSTTHTSILTNMEFTHPHSQVCSYHDAIFAHCDDIVVDLKQAKLSEEDDLAHFGVNAPAYWDTG